MKRNSCLLSIMIVIFFGIVALPQEVTLSQSTLDKEVALNLINASPIDLLSFLSEHYNIYTGIETITYDKNESKKEFLPINIKCVKCTVRYVLDSLVAIDDRYSWSYTENFINVVPKDANDRVTDILIKDIKIRNMDMDEIKNHLFELPEVEAVIKKKSLTPLLFMSSSIVGARRGDISLSRTDIVLVTLLNGIVIRSNDKHWSIYKTKESSGYIVLRL